MRLRSKIIFIFVVVVLIPFMLLFVYYDTSSQQTVRRQVGLMAGQTVAQTAIALNDRISNMEKTLYTAINNMAVLDMLLPARYQALGLGSRDSNSLKRHFESIIYTNGYIKSIRIDLYEPDANGQPQTLYYGAGSADSFSPLTAERYARYFREKAFRDGLGLTEYRQTALYQHAREQDGELIWTSGIIPDDPNLYLVKQFSYLTFSEKLGIITFVINPRLLTELCNDTQDLHHYIFNHESVLLTGQDISGQTDLMQAGLQMTPGSSREIAEQLMTSQRLINDWTYLQTISVPSLLKDILTVRHNVITLTLAILVLLFIILGVLLRHLSRQLNFLLGKFERVETGEMTITERLNSRDELGELDTHFNRMVSQLQQLIRDNYINQLGKREAQLEALKYQINPHFLYNTLDVISSMAQVHDLPQISEICQNLSQLFRYNMSRQDNVLLSDELRSVQSFIYLQQIQFAEPFQVFYDIEPGLESCQVLKFSLQPIIENAVKHGFAAKDRIFCLEINARADGDRLVLEIADDGAGIPTETLASIRANLERTDWLHTSAQPAGGGRRRSIGIYNVQERLHLTYGPEFGLSINSENGMGTTVTLQMPLKRREDEGWRNGRPGTPDQDSPDRHTG